MKTITLRDCPPELAHEIEMRAKQQRTSLNRAVIGLLQEALGLKEARQKKRYHDLDHIFGTWTKAEAKAFNKSLKSQRNIDPKMWE